MVEEERETGFFLLFFVVSINLGSVFYCVENRWWSFSDLFVYDLVFSFVNGVNNKFWFIFCC